MSSKKRSKKKFRMDFVIEKFEPIPGKKNLFRFRMKPDPRVWKIIEENGKEAYYNSTDKVLIPMEEFKKAAKTMRGIPIVVSSVEVQGFDDYVSESKKRIEKEIEEDTTR